MAGREPTTGLDTARDSEADARVERVQPADPDSVCWCCGGQTVKRHCKIVCTNCGFTRDCSDP
jgi:8-oxo-dGTP diphosphatase